MANILIFTVVKLPDVPQQVLIGSKCTRAQFTVVDGLLWDERVAHVTGASK